MITGKSTDPAYTVRIRSKLKIFKGMPNLVPALSVFFILLIFFIMGTNFVPVRGISVTLPQSAGELTYASKGLIITVDRDANIYFNDTMLSSLNKDALKRRIADSRTVPIDKKAKRDELIIRADVNAPQDRLIMLFPIARELDMNAVLMTSGDDAAPKVKTIRTE